MDVNGPAVARNSGRKVPWNRSTLPGSGTRAGSAGAGSRSRGRSDRTTPPALTEPVGELLPVVGQHLLRHPEALEGVREGGADRTGSGPVNHGGHHQVAGVVVDTGDDPHLPDLTRDDVDQLDALDDVDAPQLHRPGPLEPAVGAARA